MKRLITLFLVLFLVSTSFASWSGNAAHGKIRRVFIYDNKVKIKLTGDDGLGKSSAYFIIPLSDPKANAILSTAMHAQSTDKTVSVYTNGDIKALQDNVMIGFVVRYVD